MNVLKSVCFLLVMISGTFSATAFDRTLVPADFQAAIFKQMCASYMPALQAATVVIVSDQPHPELVAEFGRADFKVRLVHPDVWQPQANEILYLPQTLDHETAAALAEGRGLVLTDHAEWVREGLATFGIVMKNNHANVVTHVGRLERSGVPVGVGLFRYTTVVDAH